MLKILIIDDMEDILFSLKKALENMGQYQVTITNSGRQGLVLAPQIMPDLIILDIMMPDLNGWQVNKTLKQNPATKNIPVIFLTAKSDDLSKAMGSQSADAFIVKPIKAEELDDTIQLILNSK